MADRDLNITAVFSECGKFRHILRATWNSSLPVLGWGCLNPSDAGRIGPAGYAVGDPSVRKMAGFSDRLGFGGLVLVNQSDFIATKPKEWKASGYLRSEVCDDFIRKAVRECFGEFICGWGANARGLSRPAEVLALLRSMGVKPKALRLLADGIPEHPLMLPYTCTMLELA